MCPSLWSYLTYKARSPDLLSAVRRSGHFPRSASPSLPRQGALCPWSPVSVASQEDPWCFLLGFCCQHTFFFSLYTHPRLVTRQTSAPQHAVQPSLVALLVFMRFSKCSWWLLPLGQEKCTPRPWFAVMSLMLSCLSPLLKGTVLF